MRHPGRAARRGPGVAGVVDVGGSGSLTWSNTCTGVVVKDPLELSWVFRPEPSVPHGGWLARQAGKRVHAVGTTPRNDGRVEVVLADGERLWAHRNEIVPE
jgi:hypothetical protein